MAGVVGQGNALDRPGADADDALHRGDEAGQRQSKLQFSAVTVAEHRDMLAARDDEGHAGEAADAVVLAAEVLDRQIALGKVGCLRRFGGWTVGHEIADVELRDDLFVTDTGVLLGLIEVEKFLPGRGKILVGGENCDQRAERQVAGDHQIAADRKKEERRQLGDEIIEKFDEELLVVDAVADIEDTAEHFRETRHFVARRVVGANFLGQGQRVADLVRQFADFEHAALAELVHLVLQPRDDRRLHRV